MARPPTKRTPARTPKARAENHHPVAKSKGAADAGGQPVEKKNLKEVKKLIDLGKEKGYLTYDDVNDMLPAEVVSPDQIDDVMSIFGEMDIEVVDANQRVTLSGAGEELAEEEEDDKDVDGDVDGDVVGKTGDPVRMYLREMGTVSLLSREGEVEIAKKIEEGEKQVIGEALSCPLALRYILDLGDKLAGHEIRVRDVIEDADEEADYLEDEELHEKRLLDQFAKLQRIAGRKAEIEKELGKKHLSNARRQVLEQALVKQEERVLGGIEELQLNRKQIDAIVYQLKEALNEIESLERSVRNFEGRTGKPVQDILRLIPHNGRRKDWKQVVSVLRMGQEAIRHMAEKIKRDRREAKRVEKELEMEAPEIKRRVRSIVEGETKAGQAKKE